MKIRRSKLLSNSILKTLVAVHFGVLVIGFAGFVLFLHYSSGHRVRATLLEIKEQVQPLLSANQDRWRAWYMLGLQDVLKQDLDAFHKAHPDVVVRVVPQNETAQGESLLTLPPDPEPKEPVVQAEILTTNLVPHQQVAEFASLSALLLGALFVVSLVLSTHLVRKHIHMPLSMLRQRAAKVEAGGEFEVRSIPAAGEIKELLELIDGLYEKTRRNEKLTAVGEIAQQVAHDIRSPLCVLYLAVSSADKLPESQRRLIQSAVLRITEIANNLADKNSPVIKKASIQEPSPQYLLSMLREVLGQKRIEFSSSGSIGLVESGLDKLTRAFAKIEAGPFKTLISNLINNAREAIGEKGLVKFHVDGTMTDQVVLIVSDNGKGIPAAVLPRLTERGFSFGKPQGTGLGLHHASQNLKSWGGTLEIHSKEGFGTQVKITLPLAVPPAWFHDSIEIPVNSEIAIVDDDSSIHELWNYRLSNLGAGPAPQLHHFFSPDQLRQWVAERKSRPTLYLIDHEFVGRNESGLDIIRDLKIADRSYLVTSRSDENFLLAECAKEGVRVIPKCTAEYVSILQAEHVEAVHV